MDTEIKSGSSPEDLKCSPTEESVSVITDTNEGLCASKSDIDGNINVTDVKDEAKLNLDEDTPVPLNDIIEIRIWRNNKIRISKPLIPLRIAQLLWFGAGRLNIYFFSVIMAQRGLTVVEFSSVFSLIFLFQFAVASVSGIVADKLGNAKPVLMFQMLATLTVIICILIAPNVSDKSCLLRDVNMTCSDVLENETNLEYCHSTCFENYTKIFLIVDSDEDDGRNATKSSFLQNSVLLVDNNKTVRELSISLNGTDTLCSERCSTSCLSHSQNNCFNKTRTEFRVLYAVLILTFFAFWSTTYRFLDFATLCLVNRNNSYFGKERAFGMAGEIIVTTLATFVLNVKTSSGTKNYYDSMYWISAAIIILALISVYYIEAVVLPPGRKLMKKSLRLIRDIDVMSFLSVVFVAGCGYSFTVNFLLWFLDSLKASKTTIGFSLMTFSFYSFPALLTSKWWLRKFGTTKVLIFGLLAYSINGTSYSFLVHPWLSLIIESTTAFSFHLLWVATVVHSHQIAPEGFAATLNAVAGTVHFGLGRSAGVSVGGLLVNYLGIRATYRILAIFCLVIAVLYSIFRYWRHLSATKNSRVHGKELEEKKHMKNKDGQDI